MPVVTTTLALIVFAAGAIAGSLGALLGLGGGVFLVPFLNLVLGFPFSAAAAISLTTVIATSSTVSAGKAGKHLINMKLGMLLEVATAAGSFLGGVTAQFMSQSVLQRLFGFVAVIVALIMLSRLRKRNVILDPAADPGILGGRYYEEESGGTVTYRVKRVPLAVGASFIAGNVSSLLGIGGGIIKVPVLNAWCGDSAARRGGDQRVHDRRYRDRRRDDLLRSRPAAAGARRRRRCSACSSDRGAA